MSIKFNKIILVCLVAIFGATSCATSRRAKGHKKSVVQKSPRKKKAGSKRLKATPAARSTAATGASAAQPNHKQAFDFYRRHVNPTLPMNAQDRMTFEGVRTPTQGGSLAEAVIALGILKIALFPRETGSFAEEDLTQGNAAQTGRGASLEALSQQRGLNFPRALDTNPLLQNTQVASMAVNAIRRGQNSFSFQRGVRQALSSIALSWQAFTDSPQTVAGKDRTLETEAVTPPTPSGIPMVAPAATATAADLRRGDDILSEAQSLADDARYGEAIEMAAGIPEGTPHTIAAQEHIKTFSNRAVQELRRKAAQAFQESLPTADPNVRENYLSQARAYLEEALTKYPKADHLDRVRDNLAVITRDLERIKSEGPSTGGAPSGGESP